MTFCPSSAGGLIMLLLIVYNKTRSKNLAVLSLIAAFILQVNPLYIVGIYGLYFTTRALVRVGGWIISRAKVRRGAEKNNKMSSKRMISGRNDGDAVAHADVLSYQPESMQDFITASSSKSTSFPKSMTSDVVLVGSDLSTLYTAGLLSQAGMKCVVLEPLNSQPSRATATSSDLPDAYLENLSVGNPMRTQMLFDQVLRPRGGGGGCDVNGQSQSQSQSRVRLHPIGSAADDYAHTVVKLTNVVKKSRKEDILIARVGKVSY